MEASDQVSQWPQEANAQIARLQAELAHSRLALDDFRRTVSHDLRAPLRHIGAYLQIIREDLGAAADPSLLSHLETARSAAAQLQAMIDGLTELAQLAGAELQWADVDLQALLRQARGQLDAMAPARSLVWHVAPDLPVVRGDAVLLMRLLTALLDNALKFSRHQPTAAITVDWTREANGMCGLRIADNGAGFDPRWGGKLFGVFQRLHSARDYPGLGLGLAMARGIVERHGGSIRATAAVGQGCAVSLTLPLAQGAAP